MWSNSGPKFGVCSTRYKRSISGLGISQEPSKITSQLTLVDNTVKHYNGKLIGEVYTIETGEYVFAFDKEIKGYITEYILLELGEILEKLNKKYRQDLNNYFNS